MMQLLSGMSEAAGQQTTQTFSTCKLQHYRVALSLALFGQTMDMPCKCSSTEMPRRWFSQSQSKNNPGDPGVSTIS